MVSDYQWNGLPNGTRRRRWPGLGIDDAADGLVRVIREAGYDHFRPKSPGRKSKLTTETLDLMRKRREAVNITSSERQVLNRQLKSLVRLDIRQENTQTIENA